MFGLDAAAIAAIATLITATVGAITTAFVTVLKALREKRADNVSAGNKVDEIKASINTLTDTVGGFGARFDAVEKRLDDQGKRMDGLGEAQDSLLDLIGQVDAKVTKAPRKVNATL